MKRQRVMFLLILLIALALALPAYAIFCSKCGTQNPDAAVHCSQCGAKLHDPSESDGKVDIYTQASDLMGQYSYDEAVSLLGKYCIDYPADTKATVLLAKAYLGKCTLLKENDDKQYKDLVYKPFNIGKQLILQYPHNPTYLSEGLYICAYSFLVNHRSQKSKRYIKKAIRTSPAPSTDLDYYFLLADANAEMARVEYIRSDEAEIPPQYYEGEKIYNDIIAMDIADELKSQAYYKMGILFANFKKKKAAKEAWESALQLTSNQISTSRIHNKLENIQK